MKKDIEIPEVTGVFVAAIREIHSEYKTNDWNVYIVNEQDIPIEMVLIVSRGYEKHLETSKMRHKLAQLPPKSFAKVEFLLDDVLALNNEFQVTYFADNKMYDKKFIFRKNTINMNALRAIPLVGKKGVMAN
ncbi:MAG: hypothetical protein HRT68_06540 [Flavobacteriaceae bacterium]|nr:hypothetical protein [Flavobacteriaceae bacterium]